MTDLELRAPRRVAYADPPYPGQAGPRYAGLEVDHLALLEQLRTYDAWALSTSAAALLEVWNLAPEARCAAWCKPFATNGWSRVRWSWEPVLWHCDRKGLRPGQASEVWDSLLCAPDVGRGGDPWQVVDGRGGGAKPYPFTRWVLDLLDYREGVDTFADLFPGSGQVTAAAGLEQLDLLAEL